MIIYTSLLFFNFLSMIYFMYLEEKTNKKYVKYFLIFNFISIFLISGFRNSSIGTDTRNYESIFSTISSMGFNYYDFEKFPGYTIYNLVLSKITTWPQIITIVNAFIISLGMCFSFKKMSINPYMSSFLYITLYHFFVTMNATRQYISIILLFISLHYFIQKKNRFILYFLLAISFHQVSIIGLAYFILFRKKWNINNYLMLTILTIIGGASFDRMTVIFSKIFKEYESYFNQSSAVNIMSTGNGNKIILSLFLMIFIILGLFVVYYNKDENNQYYRFMLACTLISLILDILFSKNIMMIRIILYFNIMYIYFIPATIFYFSKFMKEKGQFRVLASVVTIVVTLIPFYYQLSQNMVDVLPYSFFW